MATATFDFPQSVLLHLYRRLDCFGLVTQNADGQPVFTEFPINQQHTANRPGLGMSLVPADNMLKCSQKNQRAQP